MGALVMSQNNNPDDNHQYPKQSQKNISDKSDLGHPVDLNDPRTHTDVGRARTFAQEARGQLLFLRDQGMWMWWQINCWVEDASKIGPKKVATHVSDLLTEEMSSKQQNHPAIVQFVRSTGSRKAINAMIDLAPPIDGMNADSSEFDTNPYLLNCKNGVVDLLKLELLSHDPDLKQTKLADVKYDCSANCPKWKKFIDEVTCGDTELASFLQRSFGIAISGDVSCQAFWIHHGHGANGKSTALEVVSSLLGDYAGPIASEALLSSSRGQQRERARTTVTLVGKRLAVASEPDSGMQLSEGMIKSLTGSETVEARQIYKKSFKAKPGWHPHITVNHRPNIRGTDNGIWRRVMLVPWNATFSGDKANLNLKDELLEEASGILNWLILGFVQYREQGGLHPPESVLAAKADYREENDTFATWMNEHCDFSEDQKTSSADLYASFSAWCKTNNESISSQTRFGMELNKRGFENRKIDGRKHWLGIKFKPLS